LNGALRRVMKLFAPPPRMTVSEWADRNRRLSPEASAEPGPWKTDRAPYQREMMDAVCDPVIEDVTLDTSSQVGKTEILNNIIGYYMDLEPCPILDIQPTLEMADTWSTDRLAPMLRDTPSLKGKVADVKSRSGENKIRHKKFPGGHLTVAGANSPASLAARPIRIAIFDEVTRFPQSAGKEGDPMKLGEKRTVTFFNRKKIRASSPGIEGYCRITDEYEKSDRREYWVPCPHCGKSHLLTWNDTTQMHVVWETDSDGVHHPETAALACPDCGCLAGDADLPGMLKAGEWRKRAPWVKKHAGFKINELYSPWRKFAETVHDFLDAKDDPELLKVWINTALGEVWRDAKDISDVQVLLDRRENYNAEMVPYDGVVITAGVDVQDDRLEVEVVAWGNDYESWSLEYRVFPGDPATGALWNTLDEFLMKTYLHENGLRLRIVAAGVDTGGHHTREAYAFCKDRLGRRIFALKGDGGQGKPLASRPSKSNIGKVNLFRVGVDTAKDTFRANIVKDKEGPGFCHFPAGYGRDYFEQLLAERPVPKRKNGRVIRSWQLKKPGMRNEALDCRVYAMAALEITNVDLATSVRLFHERGAASRMSEPGTRKGGRRMRSRGLVA